MNSCLIKNLLKRKHSEDLFVSECKNGPSRSREILLKLDAWAMKRSWVHPCFYGYEIKVSRADFLSDNKWPGYLNMCNMFSFVCPAGVIKEEELSKDVGLIIVSKNANRLFTKRKAPYRIIDTPINTLLYILMARTKIEGPYLYDSDEKEYWENWLADKNAKIDLGTRCGEKLRKTYKQQVYDVKSKLRAMETEMECYKPIKELCKKLNFNPRNHWRAEEEFKRQIENLRKAVPPEIYNLLDRLEKTIAEFKEKITK